MPNMIIHGTAMGHSGFKQMMNATCIENKVLLQNFLFI